ncbi:hypothetical protein [Amnibacterium setariae]|uniref:META domain-containing protein n=1 Tax=Amnibacterium setariae TaxID=2306585 RepID=A0A3A1U3B3_9MICO|nr:hypothetical protein [Amnibacterium setariae]RIX30810.1 hypothetical protein D1781_05280 [Amnibacterium setariae]
MRIPAVALAAACLAVLPLTGCASAGGVATPASAGAPSSAGPTTAASPAASGAAADLAGTTWRVREVDGETVRFDGTSVTVTAGDRSSTAAWTAQGDEVLVAPASASLAGGAPAAWLTEATRVARDGDGWALADASGRVTARLDPTGSASPAPTTPTTLLETAAPRSGVVDRPASALEGRWVVAGQAKAAITFTNGTWVATADCRSGAIGSRGAYRVLPGGRLLVLRTATPIRGCPVFDGAPPVRAGAITGIARAASFRIADGVLTLFDRAGTTLGALSRP